MSEIKITIIAVVVVLSLLTVSMISSLMPSAYATCPVDTHTGTDYTCDPNGLDLNNIGIQCLGSLNPAGKSLQSELVQGGWLWSPAGNTPTPGQRFTSIYQGTLYSPEIGFEDTQIGVAGKTLLGGNNNLCAVNDASLWMDWQSTTLTSEVGIVQSSLAAGPDNSYASNKCVTGEIKQLEIEKLDGDIHLNLDPNNPDGTDNTAVQNLMNDCNVKADCSDNSTPLNVIIGKGILEKPSLIVELPLQDRGNFNNLSQLLSHMQVNVCGQWVKDVAPTENWNELHPVSSITILGMPFNMNCFGTEVENSDGSITKPCIIQSYPDSNSPVSLSCDQPNCIIQPNPVPRNGNGINQNAIWNYNFALTIPSPYTSTLPNTITGQSDQESASAYPNITIMNNYVQPISIQCSSINEIENNKGNLTIPCTITSYPDASPVNLSCDQPKNCIIQPNPVARDGGNEAENTYDFTVLVNNIHSTLPSIISGKSGPISATAALPINLSNYVQPFTIGCDDGVSAPDGSVLQLTCSITSYPDASPVNLSCDQPKNCIIQPNPVARDGGNQDQENEYDFKMNVPITYNLTLPTTIAGQSGPVSSSTYIHPSIRLNNMVHVSMSSPEICPPPIYSKLFGSSPPSHPLYLPCTTLANWNGDIPKGYYFDYNLNVSNSGPDIAPTIVSAWVNEDDICSVQNSTVTLSGVEGCNGNSCSLALHPGGSVTVPWSLSLHARHVMQDTTKILSLQHGVEYSYLTSGWKFVLQNVFGPGEPQMSSNVANPFLNLGAEQSLRTINGTIMQKPVGVYYSICDNRPSYPGSLSGTPYICENNVNKTDISTSLFHPIAYDLLRTMCVAQFKNNPFVQYVPFNEPIKLISSNDTTATYQVNNKEIFVRAEPLLNIPLKGYLVIPSYIKHTAKWWSQGQIEDHDFIAGIQYLIQNNMIQLPTQSNSNIESETQQIPSWVKNNAGWWADGQISDDQFVKGLQYMITNGIIKIKS